MRLLLQKPAKALRAGKPFPGRNPDQDNTRHPQRVRENETPEIGVFGHDDLMVLGSPGQRTGIGNPLLQIDDKRRIEAFFPGHGAQSARDVLIE